MTSVNFDAANRQIRNSMYTAFMICHDALKNIRVLFPMIYRFATNSTGSSSSENRDLYSRTIR